MLDWCWEGMGRGKKDKKCVTVRKASSETSPSRLLSDPIVALIYLRCCFCIFYRSVASSLVVSRSETREACWITFWLPSSIDREGKYCFSRLGRTTHDLNRFLRLLIMPSTFLSSSTVLLMCLVPVVCPMN